MRLAPRWTVRSRRLDRRIVDLLTEVVELDESLAASLKALEGQAKGYGATPGQSNGSRRDPA